MNQKVLKIEVKNAAGEVVFTKNPASPQDVMAVFALFTDTGTSVFAVIDEIQLTPGQQN